MDSKQFYKETFDSIQMSEESIRKVKNMNEDNKKRRQLKNGFRAAIAAASLVAVFAIGNVAVYAATGSSLVEKAAERISVYINGEKADVDNITKGKDENGNDYYKIELDENKDHSAEIRTEENTTGELKNNSPDTDVPNTRLMKDGKKTYLLVGGEEKDNDKSIEVVDITKDFEDGRAEGSVIYNGMPYLYKVSGTTEKYNITLEYLTVGYTEKPSIK